ncbi:hypothetical protein LPJ60_003250 [Coemansia sp. RSA 2675]|nr:hypothetical protein LPJ60_003250 [Coemansia sp. RSA 2675]
MVSSGPYTSRDEIKPLSVGLAQIRHGVYATATNVRDGRRERRSSRPMSGLLYRSLDDECLVSRAVGVDQLSLVDGTGLGRLAVYRKRALALRRASGDANKRLVAAEELTVSAILPEEANGTTSMIAISMVLIFATFVAF